MTVSTRLSCFVAAIAVSLFGCGSDPDPISVSQPIGITLKVKSGDAKQGTVGNEKGITTESGNPWAAFIAAARAEIGADPSDIDLDQLTLLLSTTATGVAELNEIWNGTVDVQFQMNDTDTIFPVASVSLDDTVDGRSVEMTPSFDFSTVGTADLEKLFGGSFKVQIGGPVATGFESKSADADLQLTFLFSAYE